MIQTVKLTLTLMLMLLSSQMYAQNIDIYTTSKQEISGTRYAKENYKLITHYIDETDTLMLQLNKALGKLPKNEEEARKIFRAYVEQNPGIVADVQNSWVTRMKFKDLGVTKRDVPVVIVDGKIFKSVINLDQLLRKVEKIGQ